MKTVATASAVILSLTLGADAYAKKSSPSVSGGTTVDTTYNFNKDNFGTNDVLNLGTSVTQSSAPAAAPKQSNKKAGGKRGLYARDSENWGIYIRDADGEYIYEREAYPKKSSSTVSGGNQVSNSYQITGDTFGSNSNFNMQSTTAINGGNTAAAISTGSKKGKGRRGLYESSYLDIRDIDDLLYERDAEADADMETYLYEREAFLSGGAAKGGNSQSKGGNTSSNRNTISKTNLSGNGQIINMSSATSQKGGNVQGGNGGANGGSGGAGGSLGMSVGLPPIPRKRWLEARDLDLEIQEREAELEALVIERGFMDGGGASGGSSRSNGGNNSNNRNTISKTNLKGNGQIINMSSATSQKGGNVKGGNGGANTGNGGGGGSMQLSAQLPPIPARRWLEARDAFPEELYFEERDAEPEYEEWMSLYAREAYPEPEAEAEAEAEADAEAEAEADYDFDEGLHAREAYGFDEYDY